MTYTIIRQRETHLVACCFDTGFFLWDAPCKIISIDSNGRIVWIGRGVIDDGKLYGEGERPAT
jgi:hypothetical protein